VKTTLLSITLILLSFNIRAQSFTESLAAAVDQFENTDTLQRKMNAINRIDLVVSRWSDQALGHYYSAYAKVVVSYLLTDEKQRDGIIDQAEKSMLKAKQLGGITSDENLIMEAYLANARLAVSGGSRWKKYGPIFDAKLEEAKQVNPNNPRIYFLKGQSLYYTPKAFGGGAKKALPLFEKAAPLFESEVKGNIEIPHWGNGMNYYFINECNQKAK
jgi:hypothetical protein